MARETQHASGPAAAEPAEQELARLTRLWGPRGLWQVKIRWVVAPLIAVAGLAARAIGFEFPLVPVLFVAVGVLTYNALFVLVARRRGEGLGAGTGFDRRLTTLGMLLDYTALLTLLHFTGGVSSPILPFLIFHVIIAGIQYRPRFSLEIAAAASAGVWLLLVAQAIPWWPPVELQFRGMPASVHNRPAYLVSVLIFFTATVFLTAMIAGRFMLRFRERVAQLVEERTQFMLQTAHNLRAPLAAGLSMLELVTDGDVGPLTERQSTLLGKTDERLRALHRTIGEMLTIAKTRDWSREIVDVVVDVPELAARVEATFRDEATRKGLTFEVRVEGDLPPVDSGADLLDQLMENLVSNAIKYTPAGGRVTVRFLQADPDELRIMVEDDGIGIPGPEQHRLFGEYFRASNARRATAAGTGLGLVLVKKTVERHRGRICLASEAGQGTTVVVDLPIRQRPAG